MIKFARDIDRAKKQEVHRVFLELLGEIRIDDRSFVDEQEVRARLLADLSRELNGGISKTLHEILTGLSEIRGCTEEHDTALAVTKLELHAVIQLLDSGMHLLRIDKMLGGSGN
jgi:hypothetical protein